MSVNKPLSHTLCRRAVSGLVLAASGLLLGPVTPARAESPTSPAIRQNTPASALLTYDLKPGETHKYRVTAILSGHFPPLVQPGSPPVNIELKMIYSTTVKKQDDKGTVIDFAVEQADFNLLDPPPGPDGKIAPNSEAPLPLPLDQVQGYLNVTATLLPDGTVVSIAENSGGGKLAGKFDVGFDLRKLFLLTMPVAFPLTAVSANSTWPATDGLLGKKEGKVTYTNHLIDVASQNNNLVFTIGQDGQNIIDAKLDKNDKSTDTAADVVKSTTGKVSLTGKVKFQTGAQAAGDKPDHYVGRLSEGTLTLDAVIVTKRLKADANNPDDPKESTVDVKGRFIILADDTAKPSSASAKTSTTRTAGLAGPRKVALK